MCQYADLFKKFTTAFSSKYVIDYYYYYYTNLTASSRTTWVCQYQIDKTSLDLNEARDDRVLDGSGTSWTICKQSAPCCRQITTPTPRHWIFTGRVLFLTSNHQQCQSTEGKIDLPRTEDSLLCLPMLLDWKQCVLVAVCLYLHVCWAEMWKIMML